VPSPIGAAYIKAPLLTSTSIPGGAATNPVGDEPPTLNAAHDRCRRRGGIVRVGVLPADVPVRRPVPLPQRLPLRHVSALLRPPVPARAVAMVDVGVGVDPHPDFRVA
jgi:hypothetical protein